MKRLLLVVASLLVAAGAQAKTVRLFAVGNSFSGNATEYLPALAKAGGHQLIFAMAQTGGCSLERHWKAIEADRANTEDPAGKIYGGKSLREIIAKDPTASWDVITIQQYSRMSTDISTYRPYAKNLVAHLKALQPKAEVVIHQTWAYRTDADKFGDTTTTQKEMWTGGRAAYREIARELGLRVIPTGDAFWRVDSDPKLGFRVDSTFDRASASPPALPDQSQSLHVGLHWKDGKLAKDANHANEAGRYLGALVWYAFLFKESPEKLTFLPKNVSADFAARLRSVAWQVVKENRR